VAAYQIKLSACQVNRMLAIPMQKRYTFTNIRIFIAQRRLRSSKHELVWIQDRNIVPGFS
jgi:hypothetical protein